MWVPQGSSYEDLLGLYPYAVARTMQSLGFHDLWSSWVLWFVVLLTGITGLGVFVRLRSSVETIHGQGWDTELDLQGTQEDLVKQISTSLGGRRPRSRGTLLVWTTGIRREAIGLVLVGLAAVVVASFVGRHLGLNARMSLQTGIEDEHAVLRSLRWHNGGWVEGRPPVSLRCARSDPQDGLRRRPCTVGGLEAPITLRAGKVTRADDLEFTPLSERLLPGGELPELLIRHGDERAKLLRAKHGFAYVLEDGTRLTAYSGPDGPVAVVRPPGGGPAELHVPSGDVDPKASIQLAGVPGVSMEVGISRRPERMLSMCAALFLFMGFLLLGLVPELTVALEPREGGAVVRARSWNRGSLAKTWSGGLTTSTDEVAS